MTDPQREPNAAPPADSLVEQFDWTLTALGLTRVLRPGRIGIEPANPNPLFPNSGSPNSGSPNSGSPNSGSCDPRRRSHTPDRVAASELTAAIQAGGAMSGGPMSRGPGSSEPVSSEPVSSGRVSSERVSSGRVSSGPGSRTGGRGSPPSAATTLDCEAGFGSAGTRPPERIAEAAPLVTEIRDDDESIIAWLREARGVQQRSASGVWEAEPVGEPTTIREIASALLSPYRVRQGQIRLAGCTLEPHPLLRLTYEIPATDGGGLSASQPSASRIECRYYGTDGRRWGDESLGQTASGPLTAPRLRPVRSRLRADERGSIEAWIAAVAEPEPQPHQELAGKLLDVTVVWYRWASGKIIVQFDSGPSATIPFAGRARDYAEGRLRPPPYRCTRTGLESYEILALADGSVTVPAAVAECQLSGREMFQDLLAGCEASGMRVDRQRLVPCEASGRLALPELLVSCQWCGRRVLPAQIREGRCEQCRHTAPLAVSDPRLERLRENHPEALEELGSGRHWSGWIEGPVGLILNSGLREERILVFDPRSGEPIRRGRRRRLSRRWAIEVLTKFAEA